MLKFNQSIQSTTSINQSINSTNEDELRDIAVQQLFMKKNLNASRPSEHPPARGKNVKTFSKVGSQAANTKLLCCYSTLQGMIPTNVQRVHQNLFTPIPLFSRLPYHERD